MKKIITSAGVAATLLSLSFGAVEASAEEGYWDNYRQEQQDYWGNYRQTKQTEAAQKRQETQDYWANYRNNKAAETPQEAELETEVETEAETASTTQEAETAVPAKETAQQEVENTPEKIDSYSDHIQAASNFWTGVDEVVDAPHVDINKEITGQINNKVNGQKQEVDTVTESEEVAPLVEAEPSIPVKKIDSYSDHIQAASNFWTDVDEVVDAPHVRINRRITSNLNNHVNQNKLLSEIANPELESVAVEPEVKVEKIEKESKLPKGFHKSLSTNKNIVNNLADEYQAPHLKVARGVLNFLDRIFN